MTIRYFVLEPVVKCLMFFLDLGVVLCVVFDSHHNRESAAPFENEMWFLSTFLFNETAFPE